MPSFFSGFAVYSEDYLKFFDIAFLKNNNNDKSIDICCKSTFIDIIDLFNRMQKWNNKDKIRLMFNAKCGDKYNNAYIDVIHIDNDMLYKLTYARDLQTFLTKIQKDAVHYIKKVVLRNIQNQLKVFDQTKKRSPYGDL